MSNRDQPLVSRDVDLRDFPFTPIFRARLFGSSFHARVSDCGWRVGVTLWLKSWDQVPAGSLPKDDVDLCRIAELGRDLKAWTKVKKEALWGWQECNDGRLYHKVVAEGVNDAWERKKAQRSRTEAARFARESKRLQQRMSHQCETRTTEAETISVTDPVTASKGQGQGQGQEESTSLRSVAVAPNKPSPKASRAKAHSPIAEDAEPDDVQRRDAISRSLDLATFRFEWAKFRDHHRAKGSLMADWHAAWRTWIGNMGQFQARAGPAYPKRNPDLEAFENLVRKDREKFADNSSQFADVAISADPVESSVPRSAGVVPIEAGTRLEGQRDPRLERWSVRR